MGSPPSRAVSATRPKITTFPISVGFGDQMRLFGEIELMLTTVVNDFLIKEKEDGRMSIKSVEDVSRVWRQHNRPQVLEFRYDLGTQLQLVQANKQVFQFRGDGARDGLGVSAMLNGWRSVVRELGIRTFCTPDSDVRKFINDGYRMLELLGAKIDHFMLLQQWHKRVLERMKQAEKAERERARAVFGVTRQVVGDEYEGDEDSNHGIWCG